MAADKATQKQIDQVNQSAVNAAALGAATSASQAGIAAANMTNQILMGELSMAVEATRGIVNSMKDAVKDGNDTIKKP